MVAVLGVSGVGKSTLIERAAQSCRLLHLKASDLIKARMAQSQSSEQLRKGAVLDNQQLMLDEFAARAATAHQDIVVFDGHSLIDTPNGPLDIPLEVFLALKPDAIVFVEAEPALIRERRVADIGRVRPDRSSAEIQEQQDRAHERAAMFASELQIPFFALPSEDVEGLLAVLNTSQP